MLHAPSEPEPTPAKDERKAPFGKAAMLADNPHGLDESLIADYLAVRKSKGAPMSSRVWTRLNDKLRQCLTFGIQPAQVMEIVIESGWRSFEVEWITKRFAAKSPTQGKPNSRHHGFNDRDYHDGLIPREDGSYAF